MDKVLPERIRSLMLKRGFSQAQFAEKMGVSQQQVSNLLAGKRAWTQKTWEAAAAALGVAPAELFGEAGFSNSDTVPVILIFEKDDYQRIADEAKKRMVDVSSFLKFAAAEFVQKNGSEK